MKFRAKTKFRAKMKFCAKKCIRVKIFERPLLQLKNAADRASQLRAIVFVHIYGPLKKLPPPHRAHRVKR